jgi:hypothetical protein
MAQKIVLTDDIDESEAEETITFGYRGTQYEIDLNQKHAAELAEALALYIEHARPGQLPAAPQTSRRQRRDAADRPTTNTQAIRQWARDQGLTVSDRGRIHGEIVERYHREVDAAKAAFLEAG